MKKVDITFGYEYEFNGGAFETNLREALARHDYELTSVKYASHGNGGSVFVDGELVGIGHDVHTAINMSEGWTIDES